MVSRRRVLVAVLVLFGVFAVFGVFLAWQAHSLDRDLNRTEQAADRLRSAIDDGDRKSQRRAIADLRKSADAASDRASAFWYEPLTGLPVVGDDARGIQVLSMALSDVAHDGLEPLVDSMDSLDSVLRDRHIDVDRIRSLQGPVTRAHDSFAAADKELEGVNSSGFSADLQRRFDEHANAVSAASNALASADTAVKVLPRMFGDDEPADYLLIFQNNAEIRATGGMPGHWARIHVENGELHMPRQGTSAEFKGRRRTVLPLTDAEISIYRRNIGRFFQRANGTPDFARAAALWHAHWDKKFTRKPIDGVIAIDPVGLSYLLRGTGPVQVDDLTLTSDNLVDELLSDPYFELEGPAQDRFFARSARAIFDKTIEDLDSPLDLFEGLVRAAREGRFLVASFDEEVRAKLEGSNIQGEFRTETSDAPYVDIGVDAANGTKMSYYLRYEAEVEPRICPAGQQRLEGTMSLHQVVDGREAEKFPQSVTGSVEDGQQYVDVRIYGPVDGKIKDVSLDGELQNLEVERLEDRPVVTVPVAIDSKKERQIGWFMETGPGQIGDLRLRMTPGILPGGNKQTIPSGCG